MDARNNFSKPEVGLIVLAAGASSRMQEPKQLLRFEGQSLLRRAVQTGLASVCRPVVVVLGAYFEETRREIEDLQAEICFNENWRSGLSSSIKTGLARLLETNPAASGLVITLADQPYVTNAHIDRFAEVFHRANAPIVASRYGATIGVPALFAKEIFADLSALSGDKGAKPLFEKYRPRLQTVALPEAALDIDTPEEYFKMRNAKR